MTVNYAKQSSRNGAEASAEVTGSADHQAQVSKYQADLAKRKAREAALAQEEEFLRTSLRKSDRLKALESRTNAAGGDSSRKPTTASPSVGRLLTGSGRVNAAFERDGDEDESYSSGMGPTSSHTNPSDPVSPLHGQEEVDGVATLPRRPVLLVDAVSDILADLQDDGAGNEVDKEEMEWLQRYVRSPVVQRACDIEGKVANAFEREPLPMSQDGCASLEEIQIILDSASPHHTKPWRHQIEELKRLLQSDAFSGLLEAHDGVAEQFAETSAAVSAGSDPRPPPPGFESIPMAAAGAGEVSGFSSARASQRSDDTMKHGDREMDDDSLTERVRVPDDDESDTSLKQRIQETDSLPGCFAEYNRSEEGILLKTVVLQKGEEPLGATVRNEGEAVVIGRIVRGGVAFRSRLLDEGDEILSVNSLEIRGKDVNEVCDILARLKGTVTFILVPADEEHQYGNGSVVHVRAQFTYQAEDDAYIPCKELGLSFERGDVLHVISREDPNWWQAYRDGEDMDQSLAGLIPSPAFQLQREQLRMVMSGGDPNGADHSRGSQVDGVEPGCLGCCQKRPAGATRRKGGKKFYNPSEAEVSEASMEDLLTYEVVNLYYPQPRIKRPVVLVGPPGVGRHDLRMQLLNFDKDRFEIPVAHTTRLAQKGEVNGENYHFISRHAFEEMRNTNQFVEWGFYDKHYYGTTVASVRFIINNGKVCLMSLQPDALKPLRQTNVKPFVIFIAAPPGINMMRSLRKKMSGGVVPSDDELMQTIEKGRKMEDEFGHLFDRIVVNTDLENSFRQVISEINRLEVEPQWVPIQWLTDYQNGINSTGE